MTRRSPDQLRAGDGGAPAAPHRAGRWRTRRWLPVAVVAVVAIGLVAADFVVQVYESELLRRSLAYRAADLGDYQSTSSFGASETSF